VLVHLAAVSRNAPFERLLPANIIGAHNIMQAAVDAGVRRIVYASTCNTVSWTDTEEIIRETDPLNPYNLYGVTKGFGELLGRFYQITSGIEFLTVRIGWLLPYDDPGLRSKPNKRRIWLSPRDAIDFFTRAIEMPVTGSPVLFATSRTSPVVVSLRDAREVLGYEPHDSVPPLESGNSAGSQKGLPG
jgi:nucleoside-diphosphate-sugar epimerase